MKKTIAAFTLVFLLGSVVAQPTSGNGPADSEAFEAVGPQSAVFENRTRAQCDPRFRTFDGTCTNNATEISRTQGSAGLPHFSYFLESPPELLFSGELPSPTLISNGLTTQTMDIREPRGLNELVTFFGQLIDHTCASTPTNNGAEGTIAEPAFIDVPADDPIMANISGSQLMFFRSEREELRLEPGVERAINILTSAMDLDSVYGPSKARSDALRSFVDGELKTSPNDLLPLNTLGLSNEPSPSANFFVAGDARSNEHPVLTTLHTVFLREHNDIAREIKATFPEMEDEEIFNNSRQVNIAQFQRIVFDEWYPAITGRTLPPYAGFSPTTDPTASILFTTASFRVGHTLVNNEITRLGPGLTPMSPLDLTMTFFAGVGPIIAKGIEPILRGVLNTGAQKIDLMVVDALRNFLFSNVEEVIGLDLIALNLQRSRDHGVMLYTDIRRRFRRGREAIVRSFSDISSDPNVQSRLQSVYGDVDSIEAWIGLMAEDHAPGSSMGATMLAIWEEKFGRFRDGDRFYYENTFQYDPRILAGIPRLQAALNGEDTMNALLLRNTNIAPADMPDSPFFTN
ncbi:Animal heme peroxidase homologue [Chondrus crispus]|uniref:Animal heme peroxidase homologue n=1 Tax=Chondrus crispus TaxID=2769 RepID=R7Q9Z4_CHOCR|nr:Animal heme peroxidase homologue [Chondrus crispus]CDF34583.1 Animal heme peroxidase homologue [Chondrus crispus]|eukprot:XP_005714402.1 Animal heme peroxidase homologue [Chondrus crispus]